jgi:hypothetical protein
MDKVVATPMERTPPPIAVASTRKNRLADPNAANVSAVSERPRYHAIGVGETAYHAIPLLYLLMCGKIDCGLLMQIAMGVISAGESNDQMCLGGGNS